MVNHPNRSRYIEIHNGFVRLWRDGRVTHWEGNICCWQDGWGAFATCAILGADEDRYNQWLKRAA